ncbi:MAG: fumarylacetoacetate hydrolase family protein [Alphaproteobacteria bacterium]|nr:fumarylacetoacetate hydrolase family protein [Alphaproteobacteria bacterium]
MTPDAIEEAARLLWEAWREHRRLAPLTGELRPQTVADGYAVQDAVIHRSGLAHVGWKIGATNPVVQAQLGLPGPLSGRLLAPFRHDSPAVLDATDFAMRALEPEIAFRLAGDLPARARAYDRAEVAAAVGTVHPALEIPESRWRDWAGAGAPAFIADNAAAGWFVLGPAAHDGLARDLAALEARLVVNGRVVETGDGAQVMGHPLEALTWLANHLSGRGPGLGGGALVTTGTCTPIATAARGDSVVADFGDFGQAAARFT